MLLEGTGLYFWLLFLVFFAVYVTVKICLGYLFKRAKEKAWKGYVPIYSTYALVKLLSLDMKLFYMSLIPIVNLYYYNIIIKKLLEAFGLDSKDSIWYIVIPMYKFPELVFKNPKFRLNEYDLTNEFLEAQNVLFNQPKKEDLPLNVEEVKPVENINQTVIAPSSFQQPINPMTNQNNIDNIYEKEVTDDEKKQVTYVEAVPEEKKEEKPIITPLDTGAPKICPNCGSTLAASATTCFMCGYKFN